MAKRPQQLDPRNRLIITYRKGYMKLFPEYGYCVPKRRLRNHEPDPGGKSGHKLPWQDNYGMLEGRRCTSLEKANEIASGFFSNTVSGIVYWDQNRKKHKLKVSDPAKIVPVTLQMTNE